MRIIAIMNQKGGCGKTTTAINLSSGLARMGLRVLLADMDPQSHCAAGLGIPENRIDLDIGDALLTSPTRPLDTARLVWRGAKNLDLLPSRMKLAGLEAARGGLADKEDKEYRLAGVLGKLAKGYEAAIIDCSPSIGLLTYNALSAAEAVLVPVETSYFSLQGATKQMATIKTMSRRLSATKPAWIVPTMHDGSSTLAEELLAELRRRFGERVTPLVVRLDGSLRQSASLGQTVHDHAPHSFGAIDHAALAAWLHAELGLGRPAPARVPTPAVVVRPEAEQFLEVHVQDRAAEEEPEAAFEQTIARPSSIEPACVLVQTATATDTTHRSNPGGERQPAPSDGAPRSPSGETTEIPTRAADVAKRARQLSRKPREPARAPASISTDSGASAPLLGVRETGEGVLFVQPVNIGRRVCVAGDFNGWSDSASPLRRNDQFGIFELVLRLPPGKHSYRLVIDGAWTADPYNLRSELNPFGDRNSIVTVAGNAAAVA